MREFWIKHAAFAREEDRRRALVIELALATGEYKPEQQRALQLQINGLRTYPQKPWLKSP